MERKIFNFYNLENFIDRYILGYSRLLVETKSIYSYNYYVGQFLANQKYI